MYTIIVCQTSRHTIKYIWVKAMYNIGRRLRELREQAHLSQEQAALAANITPAYLGQLERGEKNPTVMTVEKLCDVFRLSLSEFFSDHEYRAAEDATENKVIALMGGRSEKEKNEIYRLLREALKLRNLDDRD